MEVETARLRLVLESTEELLASIQAMSPADQAEISQDWLGRLRAAPSADPWTHGFAIVSKTSGAVIGTCGYKGPPSPDGVVEIAYAVDAEEQGRGYATEAAEALTRHALASPLLRLVCAHTRPEENASTRVLTKCGFRWIGEVNDPETVRSGGGNVRAPQLSSFEVQGRVTPTRGLTRLYGLLANASPPPAPLGTSRGRPSHINSYRQTVRP